ncbi:MAG: ABC transporter permease [Candidatus Aminicenantes bacterium]|nr:ABC transporter permease [Candidatus Aminicenantes bacterium]
MKGRLLKGTAEFLAFIWATGTLVFILVRTVPGDPLVSLLGSRPRAQDIRRLRRSLRLDQPLFSQYVHFVGRLAILDLGDSLVDRRPVLRTITKYLPNTACLALAAMAITLLISLPLGVLAARRKTGLWDTMVTIMAIGGLATPSFLLALILVMAFALQLKMFPVSGGGGIECLVLPALTLGISLSAFLTRMVRTALREEAQRPYVLLARSKGLSEKRVYWRHIGRNALIPIVTLAGLQTGALLGGTIIVESVFSWPGIGTLLVTAVRQRDFPMIQGTVLVMASLYLLVNFLVDLSYSHLDPRTRHDRKRQG